MNGKSNLSMNWYKHCLKNYLKVLIKPNVIIEWLKFKTKTFPHFPTFLKSVVWSWSCILGKTKKKNFIIFELAEKELSLCYWAEVLFLSWGSRLCIGVFSRPEGWGFVWRTDGDVSLKSHSWNKTLGTPTKQK